MSLLYNIEKKVSITAVCRNQTGVIFVKILQNSCEFATLQMMPYCFQEVAIIMQGGKTGEKTIGFALFFTFFFDILACTCNLPRVYLRGMC